MNPVFIVKKILGIIFDLNNNIVGKLILIFNLGKVIAVQLNMEMNMLANTEELN